MPQKLIVSAILHYGGCCKSEESLAEWIAQNYSKQWCGHFYQKEKGEASLQVQQTSFIATAFRKPLQRASRPLVYIEICKKIISSYQTCLEMLDKAKNGSPRQCTGIKIDYRKTPPWKPNI